MTIDAAATPVPPVAAAASAAGAVNVGITGGVGLVKAAANSVGGCAGSSR